MKVKSIFKATLLLSLIFAIQSFTTNSGVEGIWAYEAPDAPYEYSKGDIIIKKDKDRYKATIKFQYDALDVKDVSVDKNVVVLGFFVEDTPVKVTLTIKGDKMTGISETPEGEISIIGKRK